MDTTQTAIPTMLDVQIPVDQVADTAELKLIDRCDSCSAAALVRANHAEAASDLLFCGSHAKRNVAALIDQGWFIDDQTYRIFPNFDGKTIKRNAGATEPIGAPNLT